MPRDDAIIFRDLVEVLTLECDKCGRFGRYHLERLIEQYGIDAKLFDWEPEAYCPRKMARNDYDRAPRGARTCRRWSERQGMGWPRGRTKITSGHPSGSQTRPGARLEYGSPIPPGRR
jgi:hypothetical protein